MPAATPDPGARSGAAVELAAGGAGTRAAVGTGTSAAAGTAAAALDTVRGWAASVSGLPVVDEPGAAVDAAHVLVRAVHVAPALGSGPPSRVVASADVVLTVLVTVVGGDATAGAVVVADLALATQTEGGWDVEPSGPQPALWQALGLVARPGLLLEVPVRRTLARHAAAPVRSRLRVDGLPLRLVRGRVVAGDGTPLPGATVAVQPHGPRATTDHLGGFVLRAVVPEASGLRLHVRAHDADAVLHRSPADDGALGDLVLPGLVP